LENLGVDGNTILKFIFKKHYGTRRGGGGRDVDWIDVIQDRDKWRAVVHTVMNIPVPYNAKNFLASWGIVSLGIKTLFFKLFG
jgi:hypothetical protein